MVQELLISQPERKTLPKGTYTITNISKILKIGERTLADSFKKGTWPFLIIRFGRNIRIDKSSFEDWFHGGYEAFTLLDTYTISEVSNILSVKYPTAYRFVKEQTMFRVIRIGSNIRIHKQSFDNWYNS